MKTLNDRYNYGLNLILLSIDEGITGYRDDSLEVGIYLLLRVFTGIYLLKGNNGSNRAIRDISLKLTIKTPKRRQ